MGDLRTYTGQAPPLPSRQRYRRRRQLLFAAAAALASIIALGLLIRVDNWLPATGYLSSADYAEVRPPVAGQVAAIKVRTGDQVSAGDLLVQLDDAFEQAELAAAQSAVLQSQAALAQRQLQIVAQQQQMARDISQCQRQLAEYRRRLQALLQPQDETVPEVEIASLNAGIQAAEHAQARLRRQQTEITEAERLRQHNLAQAELLLENARQAASRSEQLLEAKLISGVALAEARLHERLAAANLESLLHRDHSLAEKQLDELQRETAMHQHNIILAEARLASRRRELRQLIADSEAQLQALLDTDPHLFTLDLERHQQLLQACHDAVAQARARVQARQIRAPISGEVLRHDFAVGELVRPEILLFEIFGGEHQVLKLRINERHAAKLQIGQNCRAELVSFHGRRRMRFHGKVEALRNVIEAEAGSGFRVAYCSFDDHGQQIPPGSTATARIYYGRSSFWLYLFGLD